MQRYFALKREGNFFTLKEDDYYHISVVMRLKVGERIEVVYEEIAYLCQIKENKQIEVIKPLESKEKKLKLTLILPLLKEQKMDLILQKATEMGVDEIIFFPAKRSIINFSVANEEKKQVRWQKICKEASEQAKRTTIPELKVCNHLQDLENLEGLKLICSTIEEKNSLKKVLQVHQNCVKINMIVGPEGGFETNEEKEIMSYGFIPVTLGNNILRVETVPLFLLSVLNYEHME